MSILAHIAELRNRLLLSLAGIALGAVAGWFLYEPVLGFMTAPMYQLDGVHTQINFQTIGAAFDVKLRVALWIGVLISAPWWIYQVMAFVAPGLKRKEKLYIGVFGAAGAILFFAGAISGVRIAPRAVEILQSFVPADAVSLVSAASYIDFYMRLVLAFGVSFLTPEVLVVASFLGVLTARQMLRGWRWAVMIAFVFAAIANPLPSPWPMIVQALVLVGLYLVAVAISWVRERYVAYGWRLRPRSAVSTHEPSDTAPTTHTTLPVSGR